MTSGSLTRSVIPLDANDATTPMVERLGHEGVELLRVAEHGLATVPTLIIGTFCFRQYCKNHLLTDDTVARIVEFADATKRQQLVFRPSTSRKILGLSEEFQANIERGSIKYSLETIYRSWSDEKAVAYRLANFIPNNECLPAIICQIWGDSEVNVLSTRNPRDGRETDELNFRENVNNSARCFSARHRTLLRRVENVTKRPTNIRFQSDPTLAIVGLNEQAIRPAVMLEFLRSMHTANDINDEDVLRLLQPNMFAELVGTSINVGKKPTDKGVAASSGIAAWHLTLDDTPVEEAASRASIYVGTGRCVLNPLLFEACIGAIDTEGGMTGHVGVLARTHKIPAVVSMRAMQFHPAPRMSSDPYIFVNNLRFPTNAYAIVDGYKGNVWLSEQPLTYHFDPIYSIKSKDVASYIHWANDIASSFVASDRYKNFPIWLQSHVGKLRWVISKVQIINDQSFSGRG